MKLPCNVVPRAVPTNEKKFKRKDAYSTHSIYLNGFLSTKEHRRELIDNKIHIDFHPTTTITTALKNIETKKEKTNRKRTMQAVIEILNIQTCEIQNTNLSLELIQL